VLAPRKQRAWRVQVGTIGGEVSEHIPDPLCAGEAEIRAYGLAGDPAGKERQVAQVGEVQGHTVHVGAIEICVAEIGTREVGVPKVSVLELGALEVRALEVRPDEARARKIHTGERRARQVCPDQFVRREQDMSEVAAWELDATEIQQH
jgi:hypothetical protein